MASIDDLQSAILRGHFVDSRQDGEMLNIFDMCVGVCVNVWIEATYHTQ